jgi:tetratricopeptide (TPR) repeat protein
VITRGKTLFAVTALALTGAVTAAYRKTEARPIATTDAPAFTERTNRDVQINVWMKALHADPRSAVAMGQLAALHLQRAREGGGWDDYLLAEQYARSSLAIRTKHNASTAVTLASDLMAQHRFAEAKAVAVDLVRREPDVPQYRAMLGEIAMELGDDSTAAAMFKSLWGHRGHLSIAPRLSRWAELTGSPQIARRVLLKARNVAVSRGDVATETKAWFRLRMGELEFRQRRPRAAEAAFRAGLEIEPNDPRLLAAMAHLALAHGDARKAIAWGDRAIGVQLEPGTLAIVGEAYALLGDSTKSREYFQTMEVMIAGQQGPYHRAWSLHMLDRGMNREAVLQRALSELKERKDVYGYDVAAWALYRSGLAAAAADTMARALRLNTPDAVLWYHDGMIARAIGDSVRARRSLERALELNPHFHHKQVAEARAALDSLSRGW